jgi:pimeloyl-ACP methyl ester carboxylesterase
MSPAVENRQIVQGGIHVTRYSHEVPLDYFSDRGGDETIRVSYRLVSLDSGHSLDNLDGLKDLGDVKVLVYLQGGPGFESPAPSTASSGWIKQALDSEYLVLLLDQRGTGLSAPITCDFLESLGEPADQVKYLKCFRADSIVRDCESIRKALGITKWSILGQSFGGFISTSYLCSHPDSLSEVYLTGGIPPKINSPMAADMVYLSTFEKVIRQNKKFYARFPDAERMSQKVVNFLVQQDECRVVTPCNNYLTPRSFQLLGLGCLGFSGGFEKLFYMMEHAFAADGTSLSYGFLKSFDEAMSFDTNPLYAILHESIYCQGNVASGWAAHRVRNREEYRDLFDAVARARENKAVYFTGEMVFPWMFEDLAQLRRIRETAELIASDSDWSVLYENVEDLGGNRVPFTAATYFEDMFVSFELAQETIDGIGCSRQWITNDHLHDGIREAGKTVLEKLFNLSHNKIVMR